MDRLSEQDFVNGNRWRESEMVMEGSDVGNDDGEREVMEFQEDV